MMLKGEHYCITRENIISHELIGLDVRVFRSTEKGREGMGGKVVDETKNVLVVERDGGEKRIPKSECKFEFAIGDEKVVVDGKKIAYRPEQRVKIARGN